MCKVSKDPISLKVNIKQEKNIDYCWFRFSFINSSPIVNDYFVKFYTLNPGSMLDEQLSCINRRYSQSKDDHQVSTSIKSILLCKNR